MKQIAYPVIILALLSSACNKEKPVTIESEIPLVKAEAFYSVLIDENITYAEGLSYTRNNSRSVTPLMLDVYYPENTTNRPLYMFIHGGGFKGGTKTKPEIENMADYFASRGWVFVSIDYRTTEELGTIRGMSAEDVVTLYKGIAPQEWVDFTFQNATSSEEVQTSIAMYIAQRDAKAALRWILANADTYNIDTNYITVGGASAGAISTITLGISNQEDFRDEMTITEDPTLSTTNLDQTFEVNSMVYLWGSNVKLELFQAIYGIDPYDDNDPELFLAHGTNDQNPGTPFSEATELEGIYNNLGIYNELIPLEGKGHGPWSATVNGKSLSEMSFEFIVDRQNLRIE